VGEGGSILPGWNLNLNSVRGSGARIDFLEAFSQLMGGHADDCVNLGIEIVPASESFNGERALGDLTSLTLEMLLADELQHLREVVGAAEHPGSQQPIEFSMLSLTRVQISCHLSGDSASALR
jgi:hypothetical protein